MVKRNAGQGDVYLRSVYPFKSVQSDDQVGDRCHKSKRGFGFLLLLLFCIMIHSCRLTQPLNLLLACMCMEMKWGGPRPDILMKKVLLLNVVIPAGPHLRLRHQLRHQWHLVLLGPVLVEWLLHQSLTWANWKPMR